MIQGQSHQYILLLSIQFNHIKPTNTTLVHYSLTLSLEAFTRLQEPPDHYCLLLSPGAVPLAILSHPNLYPFLAEYAPIFCFYPLFSVFCTES